MAKIILVTHGEKESNKPDPGLTAKGKEQVRQLRLFLKNNNLVSAVIVCGVGARHIETAREMNLEPTEFTAIVGPTVSLNRQTNEIIFACGTRIDKSRYTSVSAPGAAFIKSLTKDSLIITSRPVVDKLGQISGEARSASVYEYNTETGQLSLLYTTAELK